jgi:hypothetical protein
MMQPMCALIPCHAARLNPRYCTLYLSCSTAYQVASCLSVWDMPPDTLRHGAAVQSWCVPARNHVSARLASLINIAVATQDHETRVAGNAAAWPGVRT